MREAFFEETAKVENEQSADKKYIVYNGLSIFFYVIFGIFVTVVLYFGGVVWDSIEHAEGNVLVIVVNILGVVLPAAVFLFLGLLFYKLKVKAYTEYDYSIVSGTVSFARIIHNSKRKSVANMDCKEIERVGVYEGESYKKYLTREGIKVIRLFSTKTPAEGKKYYYLATNFEGVKTLFVIECSRPFLKTLFLFVGRSCIDREVIEK